MRRFGTDTGDLRMLQWISGTSNGMLARSCFNDQGYLVDQERFYAILRWDRLEDAYNDFYDRDGRGPPGRLADRYCISDMYDLELYDRLMRQYGGPAYFGYIDLRGPLHDYLIGSPV